MRNFTKIEKKSLMDKQKKKKGDIINLMPQEINEIKQWLAEKEISIKPHVTATLSQEIVSLVFQLLQKELDLEFERAGKEIEVKCG